MLKLLSILLLCILSLSASTIESDTTEEQNLTIHTGNDDLSKDELQLMYQTFIYKTELDLAYKVAKKALVRYPDSIEWHRKLAEVALWTEHTQESMKHYLIVYKAKPTEKLRKKLIKTGINYYQYDKTKSLIKTEMLESPTKKNIKLFSYIWQEAGYPEEAADILYKLYKEDPSKIYTLEQAFDIYEKSGNREKIQDIIAYIQNKNIDSKIILEKIAQFHYFSHDIKESYKTLMKIWHQQKNDAHYLEQISDLGWYLGDHENAVQASIALDRLNKARQQDYERMMAMAKLYPKAAKHAALYSWEHYKKPYFFYTYAYLSLEKGEYHTLLELCRKIENSEQFSSFRNDAFYYLIKAQAYQLLGDSGKTKVALDHALRLKPNDPEILSMLIWIHMDNHENKALKNLIFHIEKREVPYMLYIPLASAHFHLQESDRAKKYLFDVLKKEPHNIEMKLFYSYILQTENEPEAFMKQTMEIYRLLKKKKTRNPHLTKENTFLDHYLRVAMFVINPDAFISLLKASKPYMKAENYANIALLWSLRNNAEEQTRLLVYGMHKVEPWIRLNQALHFKDHSKLQTLLYHYTLELPARDRVDTAKQSGNLSFGYTLAFEGLDKNSHDELLYKQFKEYAEERADMVISEFGTIGRDTLQQHYLNIKNRNYLSEGYWLYSTISFNSNSLHGTNTLAAIPKDETIFSLMLKKEFDKGSLMLGGGYRNAMQNYNFYLAELGWHINNRMDLILKGGYRDKAQETVYLLLGGTKNYGRMTLTYTLLPSVVISAEFEKAYYNSQDKVSLGEGDMGKINIQKVFHLGYPDIAFSLFAEFGRFNEKERKKGVIDQLLPNPATAVLPSDYDNYGITLNYGMQNKYNYTRVWRPYASFSPFIDSKNTNISFSFSGGIGGELYHQDHTLFGFDYIQAVNGTEENSLRLYLQYKLLY